MSPIILYSRYRIIEQLGEGGFSKTFLAEDTQMPSHRRCVIKKLKPVSDNPQIHQLVQDRFKREAELLEELGHLHNHIPELYAYFSEEGQFYLVQELISGETLSETIMKRGTLNEESAKLLLIDILSILSFLHHRNIIHRDIKPDNIILRKEDGKPVLIDFGAVKEAMGTLATSGNNVTSSIVIGTPGYMPSEQAAGRPMFSSDLYSLSLTIIYALTGKQPQGLEIIPSTGEISWQRFTTGISDTFASILDKAIQPVPRDRFSTVQDMQASMQENTEAIPSDHLKPVANSPSTIYQVPNTDNRKSILLGSLIAGSLIGASVLAVPFFSKNNPSVVSEQPLINSPSVEFPSSTPEVSSPNTEVPSKSSTPSQKSPVPSIIPSPEPPIIPASERTIEPSPTALANDQVSGVVSNWLTARRSIFGPPYDSQLADELTTGSLNWDITNQGSQGRILWLLKNNAYYQYQGTSINSLKVIDRNDNQAVVHASWSESRNFYVNGKQDKSQSGLFNENVKFIVKYVDGRWKIADYNDI